MLHGCVAVVGIPFASSQALTADCHKPEVRGQHTWAGRIADSTIQLPTQPDPQSVQKDEATSPVSKARSCVCSPQLKSANWHSRPWFYVRVFREVLR